MVQLDASLDELLPTVLLNHVQHEAVVRGSFKGCWIWTTLSTPQVFLLLLSRPRLCRSSSVGHRPKAHTSVSAVSEVVQRKRHLKGLTEIMRDPKFEPEAGRDGQVDVNALPVPCSIGTQTVERSV